MEKKFPFDLLTFCLVFVTSGGLGPNQVVAVFAIDKAGRLSLVEHAASSGRIPRNFSLDPSGNFLFSSSA